MLPLYVFDERSLELSGLPGYIRQGPEARTRLCKFWRSGVFRTRFLTEGVYNLRDNLQKLNSNLLIRFGKTEEVAFNIVEALRANGDEVKGVYLQTEVSFYLFIFLSLSFSFPFESKSSNGVVLFFFFSYESYLLFFSSVCFPFSLVVNFTAYFRRN